MSLKILQLDKDFENHFETQQKDVGVCCWSPICVIGAEWGILLIWLSASCLETWQRQPYPDSEISIVTVKGINTQLKFYGHGNYSFGEDLRTFSFNQIFNMWSTQMLRTHMSEYVHNRLGLIWGFMLFIQSLQINTENVILKWDRYLLYLNSPIQPYLINMNV
jgi:hypothetical protein